MERTLLKKLEMLWGLPIFYTDENNEKLQSFGTFPENGNPLFGSQELVQTLINRANTQAIPVVYKILGKIYFICIHSGCNYYLSGPVCIEPLSYVEIHQFYKDCHMSIQDERHPVQMSLSKLLSFVSFLYEFLEKKDIQIEQLMHGNALTSEVKIGNELDSVQISLDEPEDLAYHHTYMEERYVMDCIREGNVSDVNERATALFEKAGILSKKILE